MATAYNKITRQWISTDTPELLSADWVVDPVFTNKEYAMTVGPKYWTYNSNDITALTNEEIIADPVFHAEMHNAMWEQIKKERDRRKSEGGYKVGANWYHSDDTSRIQQIGLVMLGANMPGGIMWKTMAGSFILMTPTLAGQIFQAALTSDMTIFTVAEQKKTAMDALTDLRDYNYLSGWPLIYGE